MFSNTTATPSDFPVSLPWGYLGLILSIILFGTNYIPVKKYDAGDGNIVI